MANLIVGFSESVPSPCCRNGRKITNAAAIVSHSENPNMADASQPIVATTAIFAA